MTSGSTAPLTIRVCDCLTCEMMGAQGLFAQLKGEFGPGGPGGARALNWALPVLGRAGLHTQSAGLRRLRLAVSGWSG